MQLLKMHIKGELIIVSYIDYHLSLTFLLLFLLGNVCSLIIILRKEEANLLPIIIKLELILELLLSNETLYNIKLTSHVLILNHL
jgi:hypothetical protein